MLSTQQMFQSLTAHQLEVACASPTRPEIFAEGAEYSTHSTVLYFHYFTSPVTGVITYTGPAGRNFRHRRNQALATVGLVEDPGRHATPDS